MEQFKTGTVRANGIRFATLEAGDGPLVLCLHGFPDHARSFTGLLAPAGTPKEAIRILQSAAVKVLADPDMLARMQLLGFEPFPLTPGELAELIRTDAAKYADLVRRTGASAD